MDTHGLPLDLVVDFLNDRNCMVDWLDFYRDSVKAGWPPGRTVLRLREAVGDVYGPDWATEWLKRMEAWTSAP